MGNIHSAVLERAARVPETTDEDMRTLGHVVREELRNLAEDPSKRTLYKLLHTDNRKEINQPIGEARRQMEAAAAAANAAKTSENDEANLPNSPKLVIDETSENVRAATASPAESQKSQKSSDSQKEEGEEEETVAEEARPRVNSMCRHPKKMFLEGYRNRSNTISAASRASPAPSPSAEEDFRQRTQSVSAIHSMKKRAIAAEKAKQEKDEPGIKTLNIRTCINAILESQLVRNKLMTPLEEGEEVNDPPATNDKGEVAEMGIHRPLLMLAAQVDAMRPLPGSSTAIKPDEEVPVPQAKYADVERYPASRVATIKPITQPPRSVPTATISSAKEYTNVEVRNPFDDQGVTTKPPQLPALVPHHQGYSKEASPRSSSALEAVRLYEMTHRQMLTREIQKVYAQDQRPNVAPATRDRAEYHDEKEKWSPYHPQTPAEREDIIRESRRTLTFHEEKRGKHFHRSRSPLHNTDPKGDAPLDLSAKAQDSRSNSPAQKMEKPFLPRPGLPMMYAVPSRQPQVHSQLPPPPPLEKQRLPVPVPHDRAQVVAAASAASRVTVSTLLGEHSPSDILYLRCNLCESTYGSLHSFRKHFSKAHGHEPSAEHITIQTISATKDAIDRASKSHLEPEADEAADMEKQTALQHLNLLPSNQYYESQLSRYKTGGLRPEDEEGALSPLMQTASLSPHQMSSDKMLKCPQCSLEFPTRDWGIFSRHVRGHETASGELAHAKCHLCGEMFKEDVLAQHMIRAHPPGTPLKCPICEMTLDSVDALSIHMQSMHQREGGFEGGQYRCHFCPKSFVHESGLIAHMNEHAAEIHRGTCKRPLLPAASSRNSFSPTSKPKDMQLPPPSSAVMYSSRRMSFSENMHRKDFKRPASRGDDDFKEFAKRPRSGSFPNALDFFERKIDVEHRRMLNGTPEKVLRLPNLRPEQPWRPPATEASPLSGPVKRPSTEERGPQTARSLIDEMVETAVSELDAAPVPTTPQPEKILPRLFKGDPMEKVWMLEGGKDKDKGDFYKQAVMSISLGKDPEYLQNVMEMAPQKEELPSDAPPQKQENIRDSLSHAIEQSISYHLNQDDQNVSRLRQLMSEKPVFASTDPKSHPLPPLPSQAPLTQPSQEGAGAASPSVSSAGDGLHSMRQICDQIIAKSLSNFDSTKESKMDLMQSVLQANSAASSVEREASPPPRHPKSWDPRFKSLGSEVERSPASPRALSPASVTTRRSTDERPLSLKSDSENGAEKNMN